MPDFLTRRNGSWHFVRRVPVEFADLDSRGVLKHSTRVRIANDGAGTGLRPSEVVNLLPSAIHVTTKIPYVKILPDGRRLTTDESAREIPLVWAWP
jgi:hypothetical protein